MKTPLLSLRQSHFQLILWFIPMVFRKDKCGVMLNVIIRSFDIRVLWGRTVVSMLTCDKFKKGIREVFFSFQGGFSKMYRIYRNILNSFQGDFLIL